MRRLIDRALTGLIRDEFRWAVSWLLTGKLNKFIECMESGIAFRKAESGLRFAYDGNVYYQID